jgi:hypothetical protein
MTATRGADSSGGLMATVSGILSEPIRVADLPVPPDIAAEIEVLCESHSRRRRDAARDYLKLRYLYAGHFVIATTGYPPGLQIHAIDLETAEETRAVYRRLHAQGRRDVISLYPTFWKDDGPAIVG